MNDGQKITNENVGREMGEQAKKRRDLGYGKYVTASTTIIKTAPCRYSFYRVR